jgi:hypothetical protein
VPHSFGEFFNGIEGEILEWGSQVRRPSTFLTFRPSNFLMFHDCRFHLALFSLCDFGMLLEVLLPDFLSLVPNVIWLSFARVERFSACARAFVGHALILLLGLPAS